MAKDKIALETIAYYAERIEDVLRDNQQVIVDFINGNDDNLYQIVQMVQNSVEPLVVELIEHMGVSDPPNSYAYADNLVGNVLRNMIRGDSFDGSLGRIQSAMMHPTGLFWEQLQDLPDEQPRKQEQPQMSDERRQQIRENYAAGRRQRETEHQRYMSGRARTAEPTPQNEIGTPNPTDREVVEKLKGLRGKYKTIAPSWGEARDTIRQVYHQASQLLFAGNMEGAVDILHVGLTKVGLPVVRSELEDLVEDVDRRVRAMAAYAAEDGDGLTAEEFLADQLSFTDMSNQFFGDEILGGSTLFGEGEYGEGASTIIRRSHTQHQQGLREYEEARRPKKPKEKSLRAKYKTLRRYYE